MVIGAYLHSEGRGCADGCLIDDAVDYRQSAPIDCTRDGADTFAGYTPDRCAGQALRRALYLRRRRLEAAGRHAWAALRRHVWARGRAVTSAAADASGSPCANQAVRRENCSTAGGGQPYDPPVIPVDPEDYERRVAPATDALDVFGSRLVGELDEQNGGFSCWVGHSDWKTLAILSDYLIQSINGVDEALLSASLAAKTHREAAHSQDHVFKQAIRAGGSPFPFDARARRRALTITSSAEECFFHLGQALDRLSAAVFIIGGFEVNNIVKVDWGNLEEAAAELHGGSARERYQPAGSNGRAAQEALVIPVRDWLQYGPTDWLQWLRETRNGTTHRAVARKLVVPTSDKRFVRLLYRQPLWSEVQSLVFGARPPQSPFWDAFIPAASEDILDGLVDSTTQLVAAITQTMDTCWSARGADPQMIVQHGRQWQNIEPAGPMSNFPGYGTPITVASKNMAVNPLDGRRMQAARLMDDRRPDWYV